MKYSLFAGIICLMISCSPGTKDKKDSGSQTDTLAAQKSISVDTLAHADSLVPWQDKINKGIDFIAKGNEPFWSVEIDFENAMYFKSLDGDSIYTPVPDPDYAQDAQVVRYAATTEKGSLQVTLQRITCEDDMSGQPYPFTVSVSVKKANEKEYTTYKGCGWYIGAYRLDNIWVLQTANGEQIDTTLFTGNKPYLQFRLPESKMYGFGGCNRLQGKIEYAGNIIRFGPVVSTKMACPASAFETNLLSQLSEQSYTFRVDTESLMLKNKQHTLTFKPQN